MSKCGVGGIAILLGVALTGCVAPERACPAVGSPSGISVTITRPLPDDPELTLTVCRADDDCEKIAVRMSPGRDTVDQGCSGVEPDDVCSGTATPNGTLVGFAEVPDLPTTPVTVTAELATAGGAVSTHGPVTVTPEPTYPGGRECPAGGNQAQISFSGAE